MKRLTRMANRFVERLLRSRGHRVLSSSVAVVSYTSRDGRAVRVPVNYAEVGDALIVVPAHPARKRWWRHFRHPDQATVLLRGVERRATGEVVDASRAAVALVLYLRRYPKARRTIGVSFDANGRPNQVELRAALRLQPVIVFDLSPQSAPQRPVGVLTLPYQA